ncbi:uncharacterized protein LOC125840599 [Solanum verrucosum]|uniref:uncharacterized protein LOC125840599 n=1 Tax=Solanum verrucosum TaxID=315347 RepID=UPI0020D0FB31|nr:uncharacterized protein LOC125840599 [Solanum verrucosum]
MFRMNYNRDNNYNRNNYGNMIYLVGPYVPPSNRECSNREAGSSMSRIEDMMQKMIKRFYATNENVKEMRNDLSGIGQKIDAHVVSIKPLEQQFSLLSLTVNVHHPSTLSSNTILNLKNDWHYVDEIEVTGESKNATKKEAEVTQKVVPMPRPPPPFPKRLDLVTKKRTVNFEDEERLQNCSDIATRSLVQKKEDLRAFTIPSTIGMLHFAKALCDLGATINLMTLSIYKKLDLGASKVTAMRLLMTDRIVKKTIGVLQDVLVKVESFIFSADFVLLDYEVDFEVSIILGRPCLATGLALVNMEIGEIKF